MFENVGKKIKKLVIFACVCMLFVTMLGGLFLGIADNDLWGLAITIMICGPIVAWLSTLLIYGFAEIVDRICNIDVNIQKLLDIASKTNTKNPENND